MKAYLEQYIKNDSIFLKNVYVMTLLQVFIGSLIIALSSRMVVYLYFTPVPISLQPMMIVLLAAYLGSKKGTAAVLLYLLEGLGGFPVFHSGNFGYAHLIGPTGGFLFGFLALAFCVGTAMERKFCARFSGTLLSLLASYAVLYVLGLAWLGLFVGYSHVLVLGFYPFILGSLLQIAAASGIVSRIALGKIAN